MLNFVSSVGHFYIVRKKELKFILVFINIELLIYNGHINIMSHGGKLYNFNVCNNCDLKLCIAFAMGSC